ncbi:potassium channel family protein [Embleya hyalina]|uniref:Metal transporter n=1 Tax=Embleya hyalina TaxID=516124 RepID=A0A401Z6N3_9ACTN|nr:potassium channel family protein [Embleya hyalina]GCE02485.1 metal transporter [Embleya hyalina]
MTGPRSEGTDAGSPEGPADGPGEGATRSPTTAPATRRIALFGALRALGSSTLLLVLYYVLPLDRGLDTTTGIGLAVGLVLFAALVVWQVNVIAHAERPRLRAVEALAVSLPLLLLLFAATYFVIGRERPESFTEPLTRTDSLYFTLTVFATVGFGDIAPKSESARVVAMIQMVVNLIAVGVIARVVLGAVQQGLRRRSKPAAPVDAVDAVDAVD